MLADSLPGDGQTVSGPILGEGRVAGFTGKRGYTYSITYQASTFSENGYTAHAPISVAPITPAPPVAVVYGSATASAGELVAVAFRGRPHTRSFGAVTAGYTTGPQLFHLPDGAALILGVVYYVDRNGVVYRHARQPDVQTSEPDAGRAAARWLLAQPACADVRG
jgi:C-terminal processing protease CtpA/Prc